MKISENKKQPKRRIVIALSLVTALLLTAWMIFAYTSSSWPFTHSSETNSQQTDATDPPGTPQKTTTDDDNPVKAPSQYEGSDPNTATSLTGSISFSSVVDGNLVIRTTIDQLLGGGACKLTLTNGGKSVTKTSDIITNPSSSTCSGFDVPISELSSGKWTIQINLTSESKTGEITGEVTI